MRKAGTRASARRSRSRRRSSTSCTSTTTRCSNHWARPRGSSKRSAMRRTRKPPTRRCSPSWDRSATSSGRGSHGPARSAVSRWCETMIPIAFFFGGGKRTDQTAGHKEGLSGSMTIAWDDQFKRQNIMWKVPRNVRMNDNVVVREDEIAVFYRDGKVLAYLDRPDRYALTSQNAPILGRLIQALSGVVQQAEVYYLQKRIFDGKFGTQDAFLFQNPHFLTLGIEILQISGMNIPLPDSIKEALEKMASAKVLGRTSAAAYQQFAFADSMKSAAANPSGGASTGVGLGAGIGMGYAMGSQMGGMIAQPPQQQQQQQRACPKCGTMNPTTTKFCGNCGADTTVAAGSKPCIKCGKPVPPGLKFCGECGAAQTLKCPDGHDVPGNMKFCPECGKPVKS